MIIAHHYRWERGLLQSEAGPAAEIGEGHRHQRLRAGIPRGIVRDISQDEALCATISR
jgi:hypothetical protein